MTSNSRTRGALAAIGQVALGAALLTAGTGHLTRQRQDFQAQVPSWFPADPDSVVVVSGIVELALGAALLGTWKQPARAVVCGTAAAFFVAVFPGNIAQFTEHVDAFGLDTDAKRAVRLVFQPVLVAWALASTDAVYPTARDPLYFPEHLKEGLQPHKTAEIWFFGPEHPDKIVDITGTFDRKMHALRAHQTQVGNADDLEERMRDRARELADGHSFELGEAFKVVQMRR